MVVSAVQRGIGYQLFQKQIHVTGKDNVVPVALGADCFQRAGCS